MAACCAHGSVFKDHASLPWKAFRKGLLEIIGNFRWILGKCLVAVLECWCQDIKCERQRCTFGDNKLHCLSSPKTWKVNSIVHQNSFARIELVWEKVQKLQLEDNDILVSYVSSSFSDPLSKSINSSAIGKNLGTNLWNRRQRNYGTQQMKITYFKRNIYFYRNIYIFSVLNEGVALVVNG